MVLPVSDGVSRVPPYSGSWLEVTMFRLRDDRPLWCSFPTASTTWLLGNSQHQSYNPRKQASWFGLFPVRSPLLRESNFFLFLWVLRCFSSPRVPLTRLCIHLAVMTSRSLGCPIRKSPAQCLLTAPRSLSQLVTSFIGS